jgi:hypothetical protein
MHIIWMKTSKAWKTLKPYLQSNLEEIFEETSSII